MKKNIIIPVIVIGLLCLLLFAAAVPEALAAGRTLTSTNPVTSGHFGNGVATDGKIFVVGADDETVDTVSQAGRVYLYTSSGRLKHVLTSPNKEEYGSFGESVAIRGGYLFVSAPWETIDEFLGVYGRVYVYTVTAKAVTLATTINASLTSNGFACSLAFDGTYLVVGSETTDNGAVLDAGCAYVYTISGSTATLSSTLYSQNPEDSGRFGWSVGISGGKIVVGAIGETIGIRDAAGRVYVFTAPGTYANTLESPLSQSSDSGEFGYSVAIQGSVIVVGAKFEDTGIVLNDNAGRAYIYNASNLAAAPTTLESPARVTFGNFGASVATDGVRVIVGAPGDFDGLIKAGQVYVLEASGTAVKTLSSLNPVGYGYFGWSVSVGGRLMLVGANAETAATYTGAGHAYIFR